MYKVIGKNKVLLKTREYVYVIIFHNNNNFCLFKARHSRLAYFFYRSFHHLKAYLIRPLTFVRPFGKWQSKNIFIFSIDSYNNQNFLAAAMKTIVIFKNSQPRRLHQSFGPGISTGMGVMPIISNYSRGKK